MNSDIVKVVTVITHKLTVKTLRLMVTRALGGRFAEYDVVTGVQTCALPIYHLPRKGVSG